MTEKEPQESYCSVDGQMLVFRILSTIDDEQGEKLETSGRIFLDNKQADKVLIDLRGSSSFSINARMRWVRFLQHRNISRTAIFGGSMLVKVLATIIISASKSKNIEYFANENEAISWLTTAS